jgi:nucleotide-binding universal stress UspA family protein
MKEIICPVDFSATSKSALHYAAGLAVHLRAQLTIVHIYELPVIYGDAPFLAVQQMGAEIEEAAGKNLQRETEAVIAAYPGIVAEKVLECGIPASEIIRVAEKRNAGLIVMGTKGLSAVERLLIGSTTERVFHHSGIPVLCIPDGHKFSAVHKIVFATDLKTDNLHAAEEISEIASYFNAELQFIYIDTRHHESHEEKMQELTEKIRSHVKYPKMSGFVADDMEVSAGIQSFLERYPADILVMYNHQRSFPRSLTSSSITSKTLHHLHIPLLVLREQPAKA